MNEVRYKLLKTLIHYKIYIWEVDFQTFQNYNIVNYQLSMSVKIDSQVSLPA